VRPGGAGPANGGAARARAGPAAKGPRIQSRQYICGAPTASALPGPHVRAHPRDTRPVPADRPRFRVRPLPWLLGIVLTASAASALADEAADIQALIAGDKFDRSKAQQLLDQKLQAAQGNGPQILTAFGDFYDSLNPEQQKQVRERLERRGHGWWGRG